jgi:hypothetical protein
MKAAFIAFILKLEFNDVSNNVSVNKVFFLQNQEISISSIIKTDDGIA